MKTSTDAELMESLAEVRRALPTMRLGQLIANMATVARGAVPGAIWEVEDDELLRAVRWQLDQLASRGNRDDGHVNHQGRGKVSKRKHLTKASRTRRSS